MFAHQYIFMGGQLPPCPPSSAVLGWGTNGLRTAMNIKINMCILVADTIKKQGRLHCTSITNNRAEYIKYVRI